MFLTGERGGIIMGMLKGIKEINTRIQHLERGLKEYINESEQDSFLILSSKIHELKWVLGD